MNTRQKELDEVLGMCKKHRKNFWEKHSIKYKLLLTLIPIVVLSYLLFVFGANYLSFYETQRLVDEQIDSVLNQKSMQVDDYLFQLQIETDFLIFDENIINCLNLSQKEMKSDSERKEIEQFVVKQIYQIIVNHDPHVQSVCLRNCYGDSYLWRMDDRRVNYQGFMRRMDEVQADARALNGKIYLSYEHLDKGLITLSRIMINPKTGRETGMLMLDFDVGFLEQNIFPKETDAYIRHIVETEQGDIIYNSSGLEAGAVKKRISDGETSFRIDHTLYRLYPTRSDHSDWTVIGILNETEVYASNRRIYAIQIFFILLSLGMIIAAIYMFSHFLSRQFQQFINKIKSTDEINEHADIIVSSCDEFGELAGVYNDMLARIRTLIDTVCSNQVKIKSQELALKEAELKTLEAQINPHFLYNTLECINGLAELGRLEDVEKTVTALAHIMRNTLKGKDFLTVRKQLDHIDEFMFIQKMRYQDDLLFLCEVPESMMNYKIPKLILQPILENAIVHGIAEIIGQGMVALYGKEDGDNLIFTIRDNGAGIPDQIIGIINSFNPTRHELISFKDGMGLLNVQARIKLIYGEEYGLRAERCKPSGSRIMICLPKRKE